MKGKEKIDYKIKAKHDAVNKELQEWSYAMFLVAIVLFVFSCLIS